MKFHFLKSATVLVEDGDTEILVDPWLLDGAYYGSWAHHPGNGISLSDYSDVDYIYVSHIHPDHIHRQTFEQLDNDVPVLIHDFQFDFLKKNVESMGFEVIELPHNERRHLGGDLHINILGADNCNPENCGKWFGCDWLDDSTEGYGSSQIDTLAVFDNGNTTLVNVNDCPFELSRPAGEAILQQYDDINHLLVGYAGAGPYPQCFANLDKEEKKKEALSKRQQFYQQGENFINLFEPDYYTPFAGTYLLQGRLFELNDYGGVNNLVEMNRNRGVPTPHEAGQYYKESSEIDSSNHKCIQMNSGDIFDIEKGTRNKDYTPVRRDQIENYIQQSLRHRKISYEDYEMPSLEDLKKLIPDAFERMEQRRHNLGISSETTVTIHLKDGENVSIRMNGEGWEFKSRTEAKKPPYVEYDVDPRLLNRILKGPKYAHWNNASIGSHIAYDRNPNSYERDVSYVMNFFHA